MRRTFDVPARRGFSATAWVSAFPQTPDDTLDRLAGYRGPVRATSSSRAAGRAAVARLAALDGDPATAWIADCGAGSAAPGSSGARRPGAGHDADAAPGDRSRFAARRWCG